MAQGHTLSKLYYTYLVPPQLGGCSYQKTCKYQGPASKNRIFTLVHQRVGLFVITLSNTLLDGSSILKIKNLSKINIFPISLGCIFHFRSSFHLSQKVTVITGIVVIPEGSTEITLIDSYICSLFSLVWTGGKIEYT